MLSISRMDAANLKRREKLEIKRIDYLYRFHFLNLAIIVIPALRDVGEC